MGIAPLCGPITRQHNKKGYYWAGDGWGPWDRVRLSHSQQVLLWVDREQGWQECKKEKIESKKQLFGSSRRVLQRPEEAEECGVPPGRRAEAL